jgi:hypothetical protein
VPFEVYVITAGLLAFTTALPDADAAAEKTPLDANSVTIFPACIPLRFTVIVTGVPTGGIALVDVTV